MMRLLRPPRSGIFLRSLRLHSIDYARETTAKICSLGGALATAIISQTGSFQTRPGAPTLIGEIMAPEENQSRRKFVEKLMLAATLAPLAVARMTASHTADQ